MQETLFVDLNLPPEQRSNSAPDSPALVYHIDAADRIIFVNDAWIAFAQKHQAPQLSPDHVLGRSIWDYISDEATRQLYRVIVSRVRSQGSTEFRVRCDAPDRRVLHLMRIISRPNGAVQFASYTLHEEARPAISLLDIQQKRSNRLVQICSWCKRIALPAGSWVAAERAAAQLHFFDSEGVPQLTHGMCPDCYADMSRLVGPL